MAQMLQPTPDEIAAEEYATVAEVAPKVREMRDELGELRRVVQLLCELAAPLGQPAQLTTVELSPAVPVKALDERGIVSASIGVLNPTKVKVLLGIGGAAAKPGARPVAVPPESLIVLPVAGGDVEIGVDPAELGEDTAVVHIFRYRTVQPAFLGSAP
jgi:hypothetical protein